MKEGLTHVLKCSRKLGKTLRPIISESGGLDLMHRSPKKLATLSQGLNQFVFIGGKYVEFLLKFSR